MELKSYKTIMQIYDCLDVSADNFTTKYQFTTRLVLNDEIIEVLNSTKLLATRKLVSC